MLYLQYYPGHLYIPHNSDYLPITRERVAGETSNAGGHVPQTSVPVLDQLHKPFLRFTLSLLSLAPVCMRTNEVTRYRRLLPALYSHLSYSLFRDEIKPDRHTCLASQYNPATCWLSDFIVSIR